MQNPDAPAIVADAISAVAEMSPQQTDGKWLEHLTVRVGPHIKEWDIARCYLWDEWPEREQIFPRTTGQDIGIDVVAVRRGDGKHIAIQCKSRQLDADGRGAPIGKGETDKFASTSAGEFWAERWVVTNGDNPISGNTQQAVSMTGKPLKMVNIANDLQQQAAAFSDEECPHCAPNPDGADVRQTRTCMQNEAIAASVGILQEHARSNSGGLPEGQARGKIILPCGTGKTRISLRIVEKLTPKGALSIVLCPSIALVAQIRREYLQHAAKDIRALAVCSDETAGYDIKKESTRNTAADPTLDNSNVSAAEVKGPVTTSPDEIARWIRDGRETDQRSVIFGTYQSGSRLAEALQETGVTACVLIADEAHRTAGLRRKRKAGAGTLTDEERRIRDFTLCHDNGAFPATYRVYQTATPRIYDTRNANQDQASDWIVRTMDDETVFGVELYRKSYMEAVNNGWLSDYRIIALGINDQKAYDQANLLAVKAFMQANKMTDEAFEQANGMGVEAFLRANGMGAAAFRQANLLAADTKSKGRRALTTTDYLRGLAFALAMGGATQNRERGTVPIKSCIAFMNTVDKSKNMAQDLETDAVQQWVQGWLNENGDGRTAAPYSLEHLDATSNVATRENAKLLLAEASEAQPHGIINVGIFGEGTDSPSLSAVAFLEARRSPIDVIQAVGRAMRIAPGKETGYIICPILIPPNVDPEHWLSTSNMEEGWAELGQILQAMRAHDQRIEDKLSDLLQLYIPKPPDVQRTIVAIASGEDKRIQYREHEGPPGTAQEAVERVLDGKSTLSKEFHPIMEPQVGDTPGSGPPPTPSPAGATPCIAESGQSEYQTGEPAPAGEPTQIVTGKKNSDGSSELRMDTVARGKPAPDGTRGPVDIQKSKNKAKSMINKGEGVRLKTGQERKARPTREERAERHAFQMLMMSGMSEYGDAIKMNLLAKSGLVDNRVVRDLNILESSIKEAAHHMRNDGLQPALDRHFGLDNLNVKSRNNQADGCTIAALLLMNAAMLHQRIANGRWLPGVKDLAAVKNDVNVVRLVLREWYGIMRRDFRPVLEPAVNAIESVEDTGKLAGLERALRHIAAEAERIAETYADMGADHAGPLFNRVMGNQASDGAFFTRPVAASIAARLTLDAGGDADWTDAGVWRDYKTVDLACGSGTLLAAMLTDMKRRARAQGAGEPQIAELQKLAVEDTVKGLDINPVSLQLAASQLTAGNQEIRYRQMGLHLMPYGPQADSAAPVAAGTLELLAQKAIVPRDRELNLADDRIQSQTIWNQQDDAELEDAVDAAKDARIVIMNPPFTNRTKMGEKYPDLVKQALRQRTNNLEQGLVNSDPELRGFVDKNSIGPLFTALADKCLSKLSGVLTMVEPTIALTAPSKQNKRLLLASRYHIHTVLTCHQPGQINLSQNTNINESIIVATRHAGAKPPTRFINLDRLPVDDAEVDDLHRCLTDCARGVIANGWGEICEWPAELIAAGDWTPAIWRSPELAQAAAKFADDESMHSIKAAGLSPMETGRLLRGSFERAAAGTPGSFPILGSKGADAQTRIESQPDEHWIPKQRDEGIREANGGTYPEADKVLAKVGYLLITAGQDNSTGRLTATAADTAYVGNGWMPVDGLTATEAKALAVFINSTPGRLQLMRNLGKKLAFPTYSTAEAGNIRIPDVKDGRTRQILAECWERTRDVDVPQFRDGECGVRRQWDEAVAEALGWDGAELGRLRGLLHQEPHVRGLGYNQYGDAVAVAPAERARFRELADQWESETVLLSSSDRATEHPAYQAIVGMGQPAVPLILERMQSQGGHWFHALRGITNADPVQPADRGKVAAMQESWLQWGADNGYV